jgi:2-hydroxy-3-keto-5-methylthiopentenyl-1-phosphate phosphatase
MPPASHEPRFAESGAPVSVLIDFDGTISLIDVGDELLVRLLPDLGEAEELDASYYKGEIGSRELMRWDMDALPRDADLLRREALELPLDPTFADLMAVVREHGAALEVVSDGLGFHVDPMLAAAGYPEVPVATNANRLGEGGDGLTFPYGHPECFVCGTCKRERVRAHQRAGNVVVFVGDGTSDRYAAHHADLVFAKGKLASLCAENGIPFEPWDELSDVATGLRQRLEDGRLPGRPQRGRPARAPRDDAPRGFICGPEAWGPEEEASR